ncbi:MAG: adenylyltransferase/cytidyltransferase family protein [Candidatus Paceibacterota bacterium]|jgi:cytidyltransferase-like protein
MEKNIKTVCVSGYFNPLHSGHLSLFKKAKKMGDFLIVIVNNDKQVKLKGSIPFMKEKERVEIIINLKMVDRVVISIDKDKTVRKTLEKINPDIFANGGDKKSPKDIPEKEICDKLGIKMVFGVGGNKSQSSSKLLKKAVSYCIKTNHT